MSRTVYLDWAATAPLCEEAAGAMKPYMIAGPENLICNANPNSLYGLGRTAFSDLEDARSRLMACLGAARPDEITFTSGATEANNTALWGLVEAAKKKAVQKGIKDYRPHIVTTAIEHDAILAYARRLAASGCDVTYLRPDRGGRIEASTLAAALNERTVLASIHMVNGEIGVVQPLEELARTAHDAGILFHTDAVQALGKIPVDLGTLGVDAASFSAHKIGGPKGIGLLYLRTRTPFDPFMLGGGQEYGKRSGTQNVCGAQGFAAACEAACGRQQEEHGRLARLRDIVYAGLALYDGVEVTVGDKGKGAACAPHIAHVCVKGWESETLVLRLDRKGFAVSGGSACSSHSLEPSHVLRALGLSADTAHGALRISFGLYTTERDVEDFIAAFEDCLKGV